ncbi:discoidin domain-containing protein [Shewanella amazonensis]|uniref:Coagulation factor 5/8 type protein n=1 Tax=Shewanella amazonensis (strain ATCC BAA-1098 / SB2B) TaxID=326297 RepID=A1S2A1_SHEAM|nr:discoidin domain-containing protein [Shewanella amazonensis]ABL98507.1 coagulation factor 5/8 type protein [Shewanella amazonensis SB2B]
MKVFKNSRLSTLIALSLAGLYGCGGADDPDPANIPATIDVTVADISGSAVKGTLANALVTVSQLNGSQVQMSGDNRTGDDGSINFTVTGQPGFGINSMFKVDVAADEQTSMICDSVTCAGVAMGEVLSGAPLSGTHFTTLAYVQVPYANSSDGSADASFQANALTSIASDLVATEVAGGRNVSVRQLYEMALADNSQLLLKALGVNSKANVFSSALISAEAMANFITGEECQEISETDADGNTVTREECQDTYASQDIIKLSLVNAAFANLAEGETFAGLMAEVTAAIALANEGDITALTPLRERMLASIAAVPYLAELGLTADSVIDLKLPFIETATSSGPVKEVTTAENLATAVITGRNRISDAEAEAMAFDGDVNTKWLDHNDWKGAPSVEDPSWLQVKFAQPQAVNSLFITSANDAPARDPENFQVLASNDGETWVTLGEFIGESFDERFERKEFRFVNGLEFSYYRLNITKNKGDDSLMQVAEIAFVGPIYTSEDHANATGIASITARNRIGDAEAETMAFDKDVNTKWLDHNDWKGAPSEEDPSWVRVDLVEPKAVDTLVLVSANDAEGRDPENFQLQASNDGETWLTLSEWIGESFDERFQRKQFSVTNSLAYSSYRLNITKNKGDDTLMQVAEIGLVGPKLPDLNHGMMAGTQISARFAISDSEAGSKAFDGDASTKWLDHNEWKGAPTEEDPAWVMVQFPSQVAVNKLGMISANDADGRDPQNFNIEASNDGTNWVRLGSWIGEGFDERFERKVFPFSNDLGFSFYRVNITKNKGDDTLMQVAEIELIGPQYMSVDHSSSAGAVASARNAISEAEAAAMAFDNDLSTKWLDHNEWKGAPTEEDPSWVQIDLPQAKIVSSIAITSANDADGRDPENFNVEGSNDGGQTWVRLGSWIGESWDNRFERKLFEMGNGFAFSSYRLNVTKNKGDDTLMQIAEIELIGPEL